MKPKLVLVGGGGHCKVVISILKETDNFEIVGISDLPEKIRQEILGIPIRFTDDQLPSIFESGVEYALITLGSVGDPSNRIKLYEYCRKIGFKFPVVISNKAVVSEDVEIGEGTVIMPGVVINPGVVIGKNVIVNTGSIIEHDCVIKDHVHIAPGAVLSGGVEVGCCSHLGTGASVIQNVKIGDHTIIGAGAVVVKDVPSNVVAKGIPARWA